MATVSGVAAGDMHNDGSSICYVTLRGNALYHKQRQRPPSLSDRQNGDQGSRLVTSAGRSITIGWASGSIGCDTWMGNFERGSLFGKPAYRAFCHPEQLQPVADLLFPESGRHLRRREALVQR